MSDENDSFVRDIEIEANHTLLDFHKAIIYTTKLDDSHLSSFSFVNELMEKTSEFTLMDMKIDENEPDNSDLDSKKETIIPIRPMSKVLMKEIADDGKYMLVYEYDFLNPIIFFAKLINESRKEDNIKYPRCIRSVSAIKKRVQKINDEVDDLMKGFDDLLGESHDYISDSIDVNYSDY